MRTYATALSILSILSIMSILQVACQTNRGSHPMRYTFLLSEAKVIKESTSNAFRISDLNRMNRLLPQHEHALEFQLCRTLRQALRRSQLFCDCLSAYLSHSVRKVTKGYQIMQLFFQLFFRFIKVSWHCQLFVIVFCT